MKLSLVNKTLVALCVSTSLLAVSCKDRPNTLVEGTLRNPQKGAVKLEYLNVNKTELIDSVGIKKNGDFRFKVYLDQPGLYVLKNQEGKIINLLISPGEQVKIDGDCQAFDTDYSVMGSPDSEYIRQLVEKLSYTRSQIKVLEDPYRGNVEFTEEEATEFLIRRNEIIKDQRDFSISFIIEHLSSIASIYALYQKINPDELVLSENRDIQYMKIVADTLSVKYPDSEFVRTFVNDARLAEKRYNNLIGIQKKINEAQYGFPDISYPDTTGAMRSLSSLKGKVVLVYFWSLYSDAAKMHNPAFEKTYEKYKNKGFEIYSVCVDKNPEHWRRVVKYENLSFTNVFGPDFPDSEASVSYNLQSIPSDFLLDRNGDILARDLYGPELERWLDNKL